jgi:trehalose 2-sulfotransferase
VPVLHIVYEQLLLHPQATVDGVARFIGLQDAATVDFTKVTVSVQRDELTEEWRKRFIGQARDLTQFH